MKQAIDNALKQLADRAALLGVVLTSEAKSLIEQYCFELYEYNSHTNLVADAQPAVLLNEHVLDSLSLVKFIEDFKQRKRAQPILTLVDIGSGAGLPGIVLAMAMPNLQVTLIDSVAKKTRFLDSFIATAGLQNRVQTILCRAEELAHEKSYRENFDLATARAVGTLDLISELAVPFLRVGGQFYAQKSVAQIDINLRRAAQSLALLGANVVETTVLDPRILGKERAVVVVEKMSHTERRFPRSWRQMKKQPLGELQE